LLISGETLSIPIYVFGPETHMTSIVAMALGKKPVTPPAKQQATTANFLLPGSQVCIPLLWVNPEFNYKFISVYFFECHKGGEFNYL
jgi:hypothetical protein